jgi:hypothetical protein
LDRSRSPRHERAPAHEFEILRPGVTRVELTVMGAVPLLVIIAVLLVGALAGSRFESREMILNIHQFQNLVRS